MRLQVRRWAVCSTVSRPHRAYGLTHSCPPLQLWRPRAPSRLFAVSVNSHSGFFASSERILYRRSFFWFATLFHLQSFSLVRARPGFCSLTGAFPPPLTPSSAVSAMPYVRGLSRFETPSLNSQLADAGSLLARLPLDLLNFAVLPSPLRSLASRCALSSLRRTARRSVSV